MIMDHGKVTLAMFKVDDFGALDIEGIVDLAASRALVRLEDVKTGEVYAGFTAGNCGISPEITMETSHAAGMVLLNYTKAERKAGSRLIKAYCEREELAFMRANNTTKVPSKARKEIKENAHLTLDPMALPSIQPIPVVIDINNRRVYLGAASQGLIEEFTGFFYKTFGVEPIHVTAAEWAATNGMTNQDCDLFTMGREFLTWLYWQGETEEQSQAVDFSVGAPLDFIAYNDNERGCTNAVTKGDMAPRCRETTAALADDKRLRKAKLTIVKDNDIWRGTFDADKFTFSGLELPLSMENEAAGKFAERMQMIDDLNTMLNIRFTVFLNEFRKSDYAERRTAWIKSLTGQSDR